MHCNLHVRYCQSLCLVHSDGPGLPQWDLRACRNDLISHVPLMRVRRHKRVHMPRKLHAATPFPVCPICLVGAESKMLGLQVELHHRQSGEAQLLRWDATNVQLEWVHGRRGRNSHKLLHITAVRIAINTTVTHLRRLPQAALPQRPEKRLPQ
ncbi:ATP-dependent DNA helicase RecQ [Trypanosoma cruzi]|nr:ATP-dependent DNA helicase RecQ [Trypanosoma cruzi]